MGWAPAVFGRFLKPGLCVEIKFRAPRTIDATLSPWPPRLAAFNYATPLFELERFEEAKGVLRKAIPVAQRVLGGNHEYTLRMKDVYARALYKADGATLDDLREAVTTLQDAERTARRVFGGRHPNTVEIGETLRYTRAALRARETPSTSA